MRARKQHRMRRFTAVTALVSGLLFVGLGVPNRWTDVFVRHPLGHAGPAHRGRNFGIGSVEAGEPSQKRGPLTGQWIEERAKQLGLDDSTLTAIRTIAEAARKKEDELQKALYNAYDTMRERLSREPPDEAAVMQQAEVIGALELTKRQHRLRALLRIRALLTPEQRQALIRMHAEHRARRQAEILGACQADIATLCREATHWHERMRCLYRQAPELSPACAAVLRSRTGDRQQR